MGISITKRSSTEEYNPFFKHYIDLVADGELVVMMEENLAFVADFFRKIPAELADYQYQENKWTIKQVLAHIIDSERVFAYRALVGLRLDKTTMIPSMDEDLYASNRDVSNVSMHDLIEEFISVRKSTLPLFKNTKDENLDFRANSVSGEITARALGFILIGHTLHHKKIISERYLNERNK